MIDLQYVRENLDYDPETGIFLWKIGRTGASAGVMAGGFNDSGYILIGLGGSLGRRYRAHRIAWLLMTGEWPKEQIDHINGIRSDNRWCNLREANRAINGQNLRSAKTNNKSTGLLGAYKNKNGGRFMAKIIVGGQFHYLGMHDKAEDAHLAYLEAKRVLHPGCTI